MMDKNSILHILRDWNFWERDQRCGLPRLGYLSRLASLHSTNHVIAVMGPRRAGKSFLMRQMAKRLIDDGLDRRNILYVNLEDPRLTETGVLFLEEIFTAYREHLSPTGTPVLFLDEIQNIEGFEKWLMMMHELAKAKIVISGSNAVLLSRELGTLLTGRHLDMEVFPLSFGEFLAFNNVVAGIGGWEAKKLDIRRLLRIYIEYGAFPEVALADRKKEILLDYFEDVISKDVMRRYKIRKERELRAVAKYYLSNVAALTTFQAIARSLDLSVPTVERFTDHLDQAYLVSFLKRFSFKIRDQEKNPRKAYAIDVGLANAVGFRFSENIGRLAENVVFVALKRAQASNRDRELFYWKDIHHREVDFVVKNGNAVERLIQVCWNMRDEKTRNRELRALDKAMGELGVSSATVVTDEEEGEEDLHGRRVAVVPLWKWLLTEEGLL